jgi:hypothetical protein
MVCRWPALVSGDPASGRHVESDTVDDGQEEISHYHVEFLGQPHSHGWVSARHVEAFTAPQGGQSVNEPKVPLTLTMTAKMMMMTMMTIIVTMRN